MKNTERNKEIKEITDKLEAGVKDVFASGKYCEYLNVMSKFYKYSANNCMLIMIQMPTATWVASYKKWKDDFNRQVRKGEKSIKILAPIPHKLVKEVENANGDKEEKEIEWLSFRAVPVFDISQTDGDELPQLVHMLEGDVAEYDRIMERLRGVSPVEIDFRDIDGGANGFYSPSEKRICVKAGMSQQHTVKTTIHEIAHSILHCDKGEQEKVDRETAEVQAESVAYTVCSYLGLETSEFSFGYVAGWSGDKDVKELTKSLEIIRKTAKTIIDALDK